MSTPQEARELMKQLQPDHVRLAVRRIQEGETGGFADSTKYDLLLDGKRYPPKRVVGLALRELSGLEFDPYAFKGGEDSLCFRTLQRLDFDVVDKQGKQYPRREPKYGGMFTREWIVDAVRALGGKATPAQIESWIVPRRPDFKVSNISPDLQLLTVNHSARANHSLNKKARRCDTGHECDLFFLQDDGCYVDYDPRVHGVWELAVVAGDDKLRPRQVLGPTNSSALLDALKEAEEAQEFDAKNVTDARQKAMRAMVVRQGQPKFRRALLLAYEGKCAITGCDAEYALEAAHIIPHKGAHTDVVRNGLLLRADIHTLFDLGLLRIHPERLEVVLSPQLAGSTYKALHGAKIRLPTLTSLHPDQEALRELWNGG